jgi:hypothetical protein
MKLRNFATMAACTHATGLGALQANAQTAAPVAAGNVVLVHGSWADGSSWSEVIPLLAGGRSAFDFGAGSADLARRCRCRDAPGPSRTARPSLRICGVHTRDRVRPSIGARCVKPHAGICAVLVGHSWSGTLVNEVGTDPKVSARSMSRRRRPMPARISSRCPASSRPCQCGRAGVEAHDDFTKISEDAFLKYSRTVCRMSRRKCSTPSRNRRRRLCSANECRKETSGRAGKAILIVAQHLNAKTRRDAWKAKQDSCFQS